jgi:hypothetical protein
MDGMVVLGIDHEGKRVMVPEARYYALSREECLALGARCATVLEALTEQFCVAMYREKLRDEVRAAAVPGRTVRFKDEHGEGMVVDIRPMVYLNVESQKWEGS